MNDTPTIYKPQSIDNHVVAPDIKTQEAQYKMDGAWLGASNYDPSEIGPTNFQTLYNMRYTDRHPEGTSGYTVQNAAAITTYTNPNTGVQLRTNRDSESIVIVQADDGAGTGQLFYSTDDIPDAMTLTALTTGRAAGGGGSTYQDTSGNTPRLAIVPQNNVVYSNEDESYIWGGPQMDVAAFFLCDDTNLANPRDYYLQVRNTLTTTDNRVSIAAASTDVFTVHSTRKLQGAWFTVSSANGTASTLGCHVWTAAGWAAVSNASDGTTSGGIALAQSGEYVFDTTTSAVKKHFEGTYLYCYRFQLSAGSATISHVQVDAPFQSLEDSWDAVPRQFKYAGINFSGVDEDFTADILESSTISLPIGMFLDGLTSSDEFYFMSEMERLAGIQITMLANKVNDVAATLSGYYWDGDSWAALTNFVDGTSDGTDTLKQSGLLEWNPPAKSLEFPTTIGTKTGYAYRFVPSATLTGTHGDSTYSVVVDVATGIPAPVTVQPYKFHSEFKGRHFGCGAVADKEGNRVDFTAPFAPDTWNGMQSSNGTTQSIYFGKGDDLTCGMPLYNRYGSVDRIFEVWIGLTNSSTYQLKESSSEDRLFDQPDTVSHNIGCPAPATLVSTNIGVETGPDQGKRNMLIWCSASGPYSYDGSYLDRLRGIEKYFDPNESLYVGSDISSAHAWFDPVYREYNLVLPGNVWVAYDLEKKRWFPRSTGAAETPACGFNVEDTNGSQYTYGGIDTGEIVRLEYGNTWDGVGITQECLPGDFWPSENIWHMTRIVKLKLIARALTEDHDIIITYKANTEAGNAGTFVYYSDAYTYLSDVYTYNEPVVSTMSLNSDSGERIVRTTITRNDLAWAHAYGFKLTTSDTAKGFQPLGWGILWDEPERDDV